MIPGWVRVCNDLKTNNVRGKLQIYAKGLLSLMIRPEPQQK